MPEYRAIYKCRLCGEVIPYSLISEREVDRCGVAFGKGKYRYNSISGRNDIQREIFHPCKDGSYGFADFCGFKKVGAKNESD